MKNHLPSILPALALLTLGGCVASSNLATTENDGMYYASSDKVTTVAVPVARQVTGSNPGDVLNPDYSGSTARSGSSEYYDDDYYASSPQRYNTYRGGSLGYYSFPYADPYFYGAPIGYSPYSPYSFYDPFYRPFYGYGGLVINIGFGFGRPYYRPYGYGYGYDPYGYAGYGSYYGGHYNNGYYNNGYYNNGYNNGYYGVGSDRPTRNVTYGPRRSSSGNGAGLGNATSSSGNVASPGRSRVVQEGRFAKPANANTNAPADQYNGRGRVRDVTVGNGNSSASGQPAGTSAAGSRASRYRETQPMQGAPATTQPEGGRRWRVLNNSAPENAAPASNGRIVDRTGGDQPQSGRGRRATYYGGDNSGSSNPGNTGTAQPRRQRMSERAPAPTRSYSEPTRSYSEPTRSYSEPTRSYSQPSQPSRSYSEPSRSSAPSSSPSSAPSGGGGGGRGRVQ